MPSAEINSPFEILANLPPPPIERLHIVLGVQCNIRCEFCYQNSFAPRDSLPEDVITSKILPLLPKLKDLILQGGEVTTMKNGHKMRDYILQNNFALKPTFLTNGILLDERWIDMALKQEGTVHVSINASNRQLYDKTTKYGDFDRVIKNIRRLMQLKKERQGIGLRIMASFVVHENNMWDIYDFFRVFQEIGIDHITYYMDARRRIDKYPDFLFKLSDADLAKYWALVRSTIECIKRDNRYNATELPYIASLLDSLQAERTAKGLAA